MNGSSGNSNQNQDISRRTVLLAAAGAATVLQTGCHHGQETTAKPSGRNAITVDLPLIDKLLALDVVIRKDFPSARLSGGSDGIEAIGTTIMKPPRYDDEHSYDGDETRSFEARNCAFLGCTGGDGEYFKILTRNGHIDATCPVYLTSPGDGRNLVIGSSFENFLRFGLNRNFCYLSALDYHDDAFIAYSKPDWLEMDEQKLPDFSDDYRNMQIRKFIASALNLSSLSYTKQEFQALQDSYLPLLELPTEQNKTSNS